MKTFKKTAMELSSPIESENGSAIVVALLVLVLLTIFGMTSLTTTDNELQVVKGERDYLQDFYVSDSAWKEGGGWLDNQGNPPDFINTDADPLFENIVKNFGASQVADSYNTGMADGTQDGTISNVPYWYSIENDPTQTEYNVPGMGEGYISFWYTSVANADRSQQIQVDLSKIYKTGY